MGDENPIRNNVVPLRSDTIRLVQNGFSIYGLWSEDPNQHLKDFLKLVDSLDLDGENKERTRLRLFQISLRYQASNWLERLPAGSISTWEDLTTRFLAQFFPPGRIAKLRNDILIRTIDQSAGGKLRDLNAEESWALLEDLALYDNKSWNDPRDFAKPVKAVALPQARKSSPTLDGSSSCSDSTYPSTTLGNISSNPHPQPVPLASIATEQVRKLNSMLESLRLVPQSSNTKLVYTKEEDGEVMFIEIIREDDEPQNESLNEGEGTTTEGPTVEYFDTFPTRDELTYHNNAELSAAEKIQADCDMKATNIILQGLPTDIYSLVNHHRVAKELWERVQLLMQGTSLTKQERECKLYDAFDKFTHIKGESLYTYYFKFTQLINDMNIYKMKMEQFQVNTKFLNSLPPEWSKFVTDVKLVKYLHTSNFNQLHAYLEQHELHENEVRIMRERNQDPLAFVANQQMTPSYFNTYQSSYNNPQLQQ
ncbi:integrase, catalytic region, zinc finger, CCHC-type containing protein [Tanacetum coccineum]